MIQILMIADDFTGALDTGVQLASTGAKTRVIASSSADLRESGHGAEVLVVDAEAMAREGRRFWLSENGVWLCEEVPWRFIGEEGILWGRETPTG